MTPSMHAMDVRVLKRRLDEKEVVLLDVRTPAEHSKVHVDEAISLPLDTVDENVIEQLKKSVNGQEICAMCLTGRRSALLARKLLDAGFKKVNILHGGLRSWEDAEFPLTRGKGPISVNRQARLLIGTLIIGGTTIFWYTHEFWWLVLPAFFGLSLIFSGWTGIRGLNNILRKMPWNR